MPRADTKSERPEGPSGAGRRFDIAALREAAGEKAFARGAVYAAEGRVRIDSIGPDEVRAEVRGSEPYDAVLTGGGAAISGACSCPAYEGWGFCKHLVALALAVNQSAPAEIAAAEGREARLRRYLLGHSAEALADRLLDLARRDGALRRSLDRESAMAAGDDDAVLTLLRPSIDKAMETHGFIDWRGAGAWAEDVGAVVEEIARLLATGRAPVALKALDHMLDLADESLEEIDDSNGEAVAALIKARDLHVEACSKAKTDPVSLAARLFEQELASDYDLWANARRTWAEPLGKRGVAEFRRLANAAWSGADREGRDAVWRILDRFAADDGDVDARIALRAPDAATAFHYFELVRLCHEAGRTKEALAWAEEGLWRLEDKPDHALTLLSAGLLRDAGRAADAEAHLWKAFEREPEARLHQMLMEIVTDGAGAVGRCVAIIEARIAGPGRSAWSPLPGLLVDILLGEGRTGDAWRAARASGCSEQVLERLARATEDSHPDEAIQAYEEIVELDIQSANNQAYESACRVLGHLEGLRARHDRSSAHLEHLADLRTRHKFKRNFIRLLGDRAAWPRF